MNISTISTTVKILLTEYEYKALKKIPFDTKLRPELVLLGVSPFHIKILDQNCLILNIEFGRESDVFSYLKDITKKEPN